MTDHQDPLWLPDELATTVPRMRRVPADYEASPPPANRPATTCTEGGDGAASGPCPPGDTCDRAVRTAEGEPALSGRLRTTAPTSLPAASTNPAEHPRAQVTHRITAAPTHQAGAASYAQEPARSPQYLPDTVDQRQGDDHAAAPITHPAHPTTSTAATSSAAWIACQRFYRIRDWYQRTDWAKHTAVVAAVVAAVSLALTAWGTYKAAQVADDQLTQSREHQEAEAQAQASRVTIWKEPSALVLGNRSLDPARAYVGWIGYGKGRLLPVGTLPPCTAVEIPRNARTGGLAAKDIPADLKNPAILNAVTLAFEDARGRLWHRGGLGGLEQAEWNGGNGRRNGLPTFQFPVAGYTLMDRTDVKLKPLEECGATSD